MDDAEALGNAPIRHVLEGQGIVSTAMVPMLQEGVCLGFCGFDSVSRRRRYSEQELRLLEVFAQMLVNLWLHEETRQRLQQLSDIVEVSPIIAVVWRNAPGWPVEYASGNIHQLGYSADDFIAGNVVYSDLIHPEDLPGIEAALTGHLRYGPDEFRQTCRLRRRDGRVIWIDDHTWLVRGDDGEVEAIHGVLMDDSVFTHSHEAIFILDGQRRMVEINNVFADITGYGSGKAMGRELCLLSADEASTERYREMWRAVSDQGFWSGELPSRRRVGERFEAFLTISAIAGADGGVVNYVGLFSDITAQKHYQEQLEYTAFYDALTGLANRTLLADRLRQSMAQALRRGQPIAVAFIDLDGFKSINDSFGYSVGDELLVAAGARLLSLVRESDTVSRMGGDEFVLLLIDLPDSAVLDEFFSRLTRAMAEPIEVAGHSLRISASMGVSFYPQGDTALDADQLLRQADQAMYEARHAGKNRVMYFDSELDETEKRRRQQVDRLSRAIDDDELELHYQPKVDLRVAVPTGAEALVRWRHPDGTLIAPGDFLHHGGLSRPGCALRARRLRHRIFLPALPQDPAAG